MTPEEFQEFFCVCIDAELVACKLTEFNDNTGKTVYKGQCPSCQTNVEVIYTRS